MAYFSHLDDKILAAKEFFELAHEHGADVRPLVDEFERALAQFGQRASALPIDAKLAAAEPNDLDAIHALRPEGPRALPLNLDAVALADRIKGAWLGRAAGNMLGIPCEGFSRRDIKGACAGLGIRYPLEDYWPIDPKPAESLNEQYGMPRRFQLARNIDAVMPDDDLAYTLLGLLILEEWGLDFSMEDVGEAWLKYLPFGCTAEKVALANLKNGLKPPQTALVNNPDCEWIGADIRSDPWGYAAPGLLELAARYAWADARVSHIRNGIFGEMYFSAVIAAAFATGNIRESLELGLTEIPVECRMADAVRKTLGWADINDGWERCIDRIYDEFRGMHVGHTINCAAITIAGLLYGREDFESIITLTVMGGLDTDCTAATAGSIAGAALGFNAMPDKWMKPLGNTVRSYLNGQYTWTTDDIVARFTRLAVENRERATA